MNYLLYLLYLFLSLDLSFPVSIENTLWVNHNIGELIEFQDNDRFECIIFPTGERKYGYYYTKDSLLILIIDNIDYENPLDDDTKILRNYITKLHFFYNNDSIILMDVFILEKGRKWKKEKLDFIEFENDSIDPDRIYLKENSEDYQKYNEQY